MTPTPPEGKEQPGTHSLGPICGPHKGDPLSRQMLEKVIVAVMEEPPCATCAGMNDLVATQGQRIAELERERDEARAGLEKEYAYRDSELDKAHQQIVDLRDQLAASEKDREALETAAQGLRDALGVLMNWAQWQIDLPPMRAEIVRTELARFDALKEGK